MENQATILLNIQKYFNNINYSEVNLFSDDIQGNDKDFISLSYLPLLKEKIFIQEESYKEQGNLRIRIFQKEVIDILNIIDILRSDLQYQTKEGIYYEEEETPGQIVKNDNTKRHECFLDFKVCLK